MEKTAAAYVAAAGRGTSARDAPGNRRVGHREARVGREQLQADKIPEGVTEAAPGRETARATRCRRRGSPGRPCPGRAGPQGARHARPRRRRPRRAATKELLAVVDGRLDLLSDLKKLAADYALEKKDRPQSETTHLPTGLRACVRRFDHDRVVALRRWLVGRQGLDELLLTYCRELVEIQEKDDTAKKQKGKDRQTDRIDALRPAAVAKVLQQLEAHAGKLRAAQEEAARAGAGGWKPEQADRSCSMRSAPGRAGCCPSRRH